MSVVLHASLTPFVNESRVLKETASLVEAGLFSRAFITALQQEGLAEHEQIDARRSVWRIPLRTRSWPRNLAVQVIKYVEYVVRVLAHVRAVRADVVTIHALGLLPLGVLAKWLLGVRLVYDCHELETETFVLSGLRKTLSQIVERRLIRYADLVLVVSESIRGWYVDAYALSNVVTVLNCPRFRTPAPSSRLRESLGIPADRKIVLYQGGLIPGRGVEGLLQAFADHDDGRHVLVCMGYGELQDVVEQHAARHGNIYLQPAVAPDVVLEYTASASVGVSYIDNPSLNDRYCLPNKLFEYVMAGLPVMVNDAPEQRLLVHEEGVGVVLEVLDAESVSGALAELAARRPEDLQARLRSAAEKYSWENQADVLVEAHRDFVRAKGGPPPMAHQSKSVSRRS